jgi:hypothetical protein
VELQHGGFDKFHPGFSFPNNSCSDEFIFADYIFTFGQFWKDRMKFPIPEKDVYPIGYPHLEKQVKRYRDTSQYKRILFISQGHIGKQFTKFASEYSRIEDEYEVIIKLHPSECQQWQTLYPWLKDSPLKVIDDDTPPLYKLLASSSIQVGVNSTVIYEGLCFKNRTFLLNLPGVDIMEELIKTSGISIIDSPSELYSATRKDYKKFEFEKEYFFKSNPIENFENSVDKIISENS